MRTAAHERRGSKAWVWLSMREKRAEGGEGAGASEEDKLKVLEAQTKIRQERRRAKDAAEILKPAVDWAAENPTVIKSLERLQGEVKKAERNTENRHYLDKADVIARTLRREREEAKA